MTDWFLLHLLRSQHDVLAILAPLYSRLDAAAVAEANSLLQQAGSTQAG